MQSVSSQQKPPGTYAFARAPCCNVSSASVSDFWCESWGWRRLRCILLNFFINNLDGLASPCKHRGTGLSLNFSLHYYAPNQYVNLWSPLALGEGCIGRHLYSECCPAICFWETDREPGLAGRQAALSLRFLSCLFVVCSPITAQLALLFRKQPGLSCGVSCRQTVGVQLACNGLLPSALISYHLLGLLPSPQHLPCFLSLNELLTDVGVGVSDGLQLYVFNLMGMFTC